MVCLGNICINTLHKGAKDDDDDDDDNNNYNNKGQITNPQTEEGIRTRFTRNYVYEVETKKCVWTFNVKGFE
jgi:hypothetical protein